MCISKVVMIVEGVKLLGVQFDAAVSTHVCPQGLQGRAVVLFLVIELFKRSKTPAGTKFKQLFKQYRQI